MRRIMREELLVGHTYADKDGDTYEFKGFDDKGHVQFITDGGYVFDCLFDSFFLEEVPDE